MIVWSLQRLPTWLLHLFVDTTCSECLWHTLIVVFLVYLGCRLYSLWRESRSLPPGPYGLPFVGYLPYVKGGLHEELTLLSRRHGPVFSLRLGSELMVVLSDHRVIREAFRREEFAFRPDNEFMKLLDGYGKFLPGFLPSFFANSFLSPACLLTECILNLLLCRNY